MHRYMGGIVKGLGGRHLGINGVQDHMHLLVGSRATHCLPDFMRELKKDSSIWVHRDLHLETFAWHKGYPAFTVSANMRSTVYQCIAKQELHHRDHTFREELIDMLDKVDIQYDPKYLD